MHTQPSTLDLILSAAEQEFLEKGYEAASLREIAGKAGVTTGALYGYFKNKQELFGALVDEEYCHMLALYDEILRDFHRLPLQEQAARMFSYTSKGMTLMSGYIYDHWNAFKLILCSAKGTPYCHLVEEMVDRDVRATDDYSQSSREAGIPLRPVNPTLLRMLNYGMFSTFFEMVRQDLPREQTGEYIDQLLQFYVGGWEKLWGG